MKELFMMLQTSFKLLLVPFQIDGRRFSCFSGCSSTFLYVICSFSQFQWFNFYSQVPCLWLDHSISVCICDLTEARCTFRVGLRFATGNALGVVDVGPRQRLLSTSPPCPALPWSLYVLLMVWSFSLYFYGKPENS